MCSHAKTLKEFSAYNHNSSHANISQDSRVEFKRLPFIRLCQKWWKHDDVAVMNCHSADSNGENGRDELIYQSDIPFVLLSDWSVAKTGKARLTRWLIVCSRSLSASWSGSSELNGWGLCVCMCGCLLFRPSYLLRKMLTCIPVLSLCSWSAEIIEKVT